MKQTKNKLWIEWHCRKCGHKWIPRSNVSKPKSCPKCKRYDWFVEKDIEKDDLIRKEDNEDDKLL